MTKAGGLQETSEFQYTVPQSICKRCSFQGEVVDIMTASAALAVMDDLSASAVMIADKKFRPGVSVSLSSEILHPIRAGQTVVARFVTDKIGKSLGFQSMELFDQASNITLARGKHIKFMPMGTLYETIFSADSIERVLNLSFKYPWINSYINRLYGFDSVPSPILSAEEENLVGSVYRALNVQPSGEGYFVKLRQGMRMIQGNMHGGAVAMSAEQAADAALQSLDRTDLFLRQIQVTYLSALKGDVVIKCASSSASTVMTGDEIAIEGSMFSSSAKRVEKLPSVQFSCEWIALK